jgi:hypothetical protein
LKRILFLLICPVLAVGLMAGAPGANPTRSTAVSSQRALPNDAQIETTIRGKLAKSKIGRDGFRFRVQRGVVTWEGTTNVMQHKGSATRMARAAGAVQVINNIQVSAAAKAKAAGNLHKATVQE